MAKIESRAGTVRANDEVIYNLLSDFRNFVHLLPPDKVKDWQADAATCSFSVDGVGRIALKMAEKSPFTLIKVSSTEGTGVPFHLWVQLKKIAEYETRVRVTIDPEVNQMVMMMIRSPLQIFVDAMVSQLETYRF